MNKDINSVEELIDYSQQVNPVEPPSDRKIVHEKTANFTTECANCIFAEWDHSEYHGDDDIPPTQTGCSMNRLESFKQNCDVQLEDGSYIIPRICNTFRDQQWLDQTLEDSEVEIDDNCKKYVREFVKISTGVVIIEDTDEPLQKCYSRLLRTMDNLYAMDIPVNSVVIVLNNNSISPYEYIIDRVEPLMREYNDMPFLAIRNFEENPVFERLVDVGAKKVDNTFFFALRAGDKVPKDFTSKLDRAINDQMKQISLVLGQPNIVQTKLHNLLHGNDGGYIEDKIKKLAEEQELKHMVVEWDKL